MQLHHGPPDDSHLTVNESRDASQFAAQNGAAQPVLPDIAQDEPPMPSLERMHQIVAEDPRAQAKFFILMTELHYRYLVGLDRLHIGRLRLAAPREPHHDDVAASLQPCIAPGTTDVQAPFEGQGRGFVHGHGKGHSIIGTSMRWIRKLAKQSAAGIGTCIRQMRESLLSAAVTVQYESANEPGRQMGVSDLPPEPFSDKQQKQSRMDGGVDEDGSLREDVPRAPPIVQPYIEKERNRAGAENRQTRTGATAYREVPITGAFQSSFPWFRQRFSFGNLRNAPGDSAQPAHRQLEQLFALGEDGHVQSILSASGDVATEAEVDADAKAWATHFAHDVRNNHCSNHDHDCKETCVKYVHKKLQAKESLAANKVPSCRFWFFRIKTIDIPGCRKRLRRRGKPLVKEPYIVEDDDRNEQHRCKVKRETPFRSTSNDVCQGCDRCNVDFQFLPCAPSEVPQPDAAPTVSSGDASQLSGAETSKPKWLSGCDFKHIGPKAASMLKSFSESFRHGLLHYQIPRKNQWRQPPCATPHRKHH